LPTKYLLHTPQGSLPCSKILRHGANGFTSAPKEVVKPILSPLKIHCPRPDLQPHTLGPMASTPTTRTPRITIAVWLCMDSIHVRPAPHLYLLIPYDKQRQHGVRSNLRRESSNRGTWCRIVRFCVVTKLRKVLNFW
jgi:hypothetical protein